MRRLPRLRGSASALSSSTTSCLKTPIAATTFSSSASTATRHISVTARKSHGWQNTLQRRCLSTSTIRCDKQQQTPTATTTEDVSSTPAAIAEEQPTAETALEEGEYFTDELLESSASTPYIETDLVYPRETVEAKSAEEITDPDYIPAESGIGLEEVGGLQDWWDRPGHWGESKKYAGFGALEKVKDFAVMEVLTRRAVVEALAIQAYAKSGASKEDVDAALQSVVGAEEVLGIEDVELVPSGEGGAVAVKDQEDLKAVWEELLGKKQDGDAAVLGPETPAIGYEEARNLIKVWGSEWKKGTVQDPVLKFYIAKRLQRLTGHVIPDAKIHGASVTVGGIISAMARKPKPKKLAELLDKMGVLADLPNVQVYPRRVTPIDKEQMVGRWKLIQKELEARELPVTGHDGKHSKTAEWKWARGQS